MRMAFLFRVFVSEEQSIYIVKIARCIDYVVGRVAWMDDPTLPEWNDYTNSGTLVPDIDITEESHTFSSEKEALNFMAQHYASELAAA